MIQICADAPWIVLGSSKKIVMLLRHGMTCLVCLEV
jgi:hypothetical protein